MAMVDVDGSCHLSADSQPKSVGLVWGLAATLRSVCIHQMNWVNSRSDHGREDSTINIVVELLLLLLLCCQYTAKKSPINEKCLVQMLNVAVASHNEQAACSCLFW